MPDIWASKSLDPTAQACALPVQVVRRDNVRPALEEEEDLILGLARARAVVHVDHHLKHQ
jgi:hypothetical protein